MSSSIDPLNRGLTSPFNQGSRDLTSLRSSAINNLAAQSMSNIPAEIKFKIIYCANIIGEAAVKTQELWHKEIMNSGKTERSRRSSDISPNSVSRQDPAVAPNQIAPELVDLSQDLTVAELKALSRSVSSWAIFGLIHNFSILGGSPNRKVDFGKVSNIIGRSRNSENFETEALNRYVDYCAEQMQWGFIQKMLQSVWIRTSYWFLSGSVPIIVEKAFDNVLSKVRSEGAIEGNVEFVLWKLVDRLDLLLKRCNDNDNDNDNASLQSDFDSANLDLNALCEELSPFLFDEFFPKLTLCEDRFKKIPLLGFLSFLCRPIDILLNSWIRHTAKKSFPNLFKKAVEALQRVVGGKETINYRIANPILTFLNGQLEELIKLIKAPPSGSNGPLSADVLQKLEPVVDKLMKLSKIPSCQARVTQNLLDLAKDSPSDVIGQKLQDLANGSARGEDRRRVMQPLALEIRDSWLDGSLRLDAFAAELNDREKIREEIRGGIVKGIYFVMKYCEQKQETLLHKAFHQVTASLFSDNQGPPLEEVEIKRRYNSSLGSLQELGQKLSESIISSEVYKRAAKHLYGDPEAQINDHWNREYERIVSYFKEGSCDHDASILKTLQIAKTSLSTGTDTNCLDVLAKHLMFWKGVCSLLESATQDHAPEKSRQKIVETFSWLYKEIDSQLNKIISLKQEWDVYLIRRELKELYARMQTKVNEKITALNEAREKEAAGVLGLFFLWVRELISPSQKISENSAEIASITAAIKDLRGKESSLRNSEPKVRPTRNLGINLQNINDAELALEDALLISCNEFENYKNGADAENVTEDQIGQLRSQIEQALAKYEKKSNEYKRKLVTGLDRLHTEHSECLEKIKRIECKKIPGTWAETLPFAHVAASFVGVTVYRGQVNSNKEYLKSDVKNIFDALIPLVIGNPIDSSDEDFSDDDTIKENLYTSLEELALSSLLNHYQSQAH